jgi:hypothetical protein
MATGVMGGFNERLPNMRRHIEEWVLKRGLRDVSVSAPDWGVIDHDYPSTVPLRIMSIAPLSLGCDLFIAPSGAIGMSLFLRSGVHSHPCRAVGGFEISHDVLWDGVESVLDACRMGRFALIQHYLFGLCVSRVVVATGLNELADGGIRALLPRSFEEVHSPPMLTTTCLGIHSWT